MKRLRAEKKEDGSYLVTLRLKSGEKYDNSDVERLLLKNIYHITLAEYHKHGLFQQTLEARIANAEILDDRIKMPMSYDEFVRLLSSLLQCLEAAVNAGMQMNRLVLDADYIFVRHSGEVELLYFPASFEGENVNLFRFIGDFVDSIKLSRIRDLSALKNQIHAMQELDFAKIREMLNADSSSHTVEPDDQLFDFRDVTVLEDVPKKSKKPSPPLEIMDISAEDDATTLLDETDRAVGVFTSLDSQKMFTVNKDSFLIGRKESLTDYCIVGNKAVGRVHAEIIRENEKFYIRDNYSSNGTKINGMKIDPRHKTELKDGSKVSFANEDFIFNVRKD